MFQNRWKSSAAVWSVLTLATVLRVEPVWAQKSDDWNALSQEMGTKSQLDQASPDVWVLKPAAPVAAMPLAAHVPASDFQAIRSNQQTLVPLPAGEWTGLSCLAGLALVRARKMIRRILA
ncbi:MAG TPA: hypothetical protein VF669_20695 [Tepidisphaeraceae bacterium]|jgi:hypothetical protein